MGKSQLERSFHKAQTDQDAKDARKAEGRKVQDQFMERYLAQRDIVVTKPPPTKDASHSSPFKNFKKDDVKKLNQPSGSEMRNFRKLILERYPTLEETSFAKDIWPKKIEVGAVSVAKCEEKINLIIIGGETLFFQQGKGPWIPTLKLIHKFPDIMPKMQVDKGGIKFVLRGASVMCPGLTSAGGKVADDLEAGATVQVTAEDKEHACAVGVLIMSSEEIRTKNKGSCIGDTHYLGDGLWHLPPLLLISDVDFHGNHVEFFIPGLLLFTSFMLALVGLRGLHSFDKPVGAELLMHRRF